MAWNIIIQIISGITYNPKEELLYIKLSFLILYNIKILTITKYNKEKREENFFFLLLLNCKLILIHSLNFSN